MQFWNDQYMTFAQRIDVHKGHDPFVLKNHDGRQLIICDFAESTGWHEEALAMGYRYSAAHKKRARRGDINKINIRPVVFCIIVNYPFSFRSFDIMTPNVEI